MSSKLVDVKPDRIVIERTVLKALSDGFIDKQVTLPKVTMHLQWLEGRK